MIQVHFTSNLECIQEDGEQPGTSRDMDDDPDDLSEPLSSTAIELGKIALQIFYHFCSKIVKNTSFLQLHSQNHQHSLL